MRINLVSEDEIGILPFPCPASPSVPVRYDRAAPPTDRRSGHPTGSGRVQQYNISQ